MIFATVGTQLPFPRLIDALDALAAGLDEQILAQTGPAPPGTAWSNLDCHENLAPAAFDAAFREARLVVGHAGMGTVLSARRFGKPLIVLPRRHAMGEHRNDHQIATARQLDGLPGLTVAWQAEDLQALLTGPVPPAPGDAAQSPAHDALIARLHSFIVA